MSATQAEPLQLLTPAGEFVRSDATEPYLARIDAADAAMWRDAYRAMVFVRAFDREGTRLQRQGQLALYIPCEGQEGAQIGSGLAARPHDHIFPSYREHGVGFVRGLDLLRVLAVLRGTTNGGWLTAETRNFHNYVFVIAAHTLHATGFAMGQVFEGATGTGNPDTDEATLVYFGDGATSEGDLNESLIWAKSFNTAQVFFLQNNQWAISVPVCVQSPVPLVGRPSGFGIPGVRIDGNDVFAAYAVTAELLDRARAGEGPQFIEALTYRMGAHTTSDDPTKYRTADEEQYWRDRDPITRLAAWLRAQGEPASFFTDLDTQAADYANDLRRRLLALPEPDPLDLFTGVYASEHPLITADRESYLEFEASLETVAAEPAQEGK